MKKNFKFLASLLVITLFLGCTEEETPQGNSGISALIVSANIQGNLVATNTLVTFNAVGDNDIDYSTDANFSVNGNPINSFQYEFVNPGNYTVTAELDGIVSNGLEIQVVNPETRMLVVPEDRGMRNQPMQFQLLGPDGNDYASSATFYVNGTAIQGSSFSSNEEGIFEVYATYEILGSQSTTDTQEIEIFIPKRKVLFEDYTGTWCPACTHMLERIDLMKAATDNVTVVAVHVGSQDPFVADEAQTLIDAYEVIFVPTAFTNRQYFFGFLDNYEWALTGAGDEVNTSIALNSSLDGNELTVEASVISEDALEDKRLVLLLLENGLIYDQDNAGNNDPDSPYYMMGNPIPDFVHNDVLRESFTDIFGDAIPSTPAYSKYTREFNMTVPSGYNLDNLSLVAFVTDTENVSINSQYADVGENKGFE